MKLAYAKKISDEIIEIPIVGAIGETVNGDYVAADISFINRSNACKQINLRINTEGGNVINGFKIIGAVLNSKIPVHTYNDGIAYSMGFQIWLSAKKDNRHASFFASWMAHAARFVNEENEIVQPEAEADKTFLDVMNRSMSDYTLEATGKSKQDILKMFSKDTFFNPLEMVSNGFINKENIIKYNDMPQINAEMSIQEKINKIAAFYSDNHKPNNNKRMELKALALEMGLNSEASVDSFVAKHKEVVANLNEAKDTIATLQEGEEKNLSAIKDLEVNTKDLEAKIEDYEVKETELKAEASKAKVGKAIEEGKFKEEDREELNAMATENPEMFEKFVAKAQVKLSVQAPDITAQLTGNQLTEVAAKVGIKAENLDYGYLWKNEPQKLEDLKAEAPRLYDVLEAKWIKENK